MLCIHGRIRTGLKGILNQLSAENKNNSLDPYGLTQVRIAEEPTGFCYRTMCHLTAANSFADLAILKWAKHKTTEMTRTSF